MILTLQALTWTCNIYNIKQVEYKGNPYKEEKDAFIKAEKEKFIKECDPLPDFIIILENTRFHSRHQVYEVNKTRETNY